MRSNHPRMPRTAGGPELDALAALLGSARDLVGELAKGTTQRALRALAAIAPDERVAITIALERAAETWRQNESFTHLHNVRVRANPNAQLFIRIFDDVDEPAPSQHFDVLPETLRVMRRLGASMRPELRAAWEPAVVTAREMLTPDELRSCLEFLTRALELVSAAADADPSIVVEETAAEQHRSGAGKGGSKPGKRS
jgi:hypothetical protein